MTTRLPVAALLVVAGLAPAQDPKADPVKPAPSKVVAVTVYQNTALVTREVTVPEAAGLTEVVVSPLPPATLATLALRRGRPTASAS